MCSECEVLRARLERAERARRTEQALYDSELYRLGGINQPTVKMRRHSLPEFLQCKTLSQVTKLVLLDAMARNDDHKPGVARDLDISLKTVYRMLEKYGLND